MDRETATIVQSWLTHQVTVAQAEAESLAQIREVNQMPPYPGYPASAKIPEIPFGPTNDAWRQFLAFFRPGDTLWHFRSPPETWRALAGREGYAIVRRGQVMGTFTTMLS